ncbi:FAD-dependent oxidoreductase [Streptomyces sp. MAR4 CNX-425]|uniref:FAD-dependent oxidoreductase n=1 Tax=Streptomyces sp. MAR4 CNX-425 TaxID=3406343 RepID=UPI003B5140CD
MCRRYRLREDGSLERTTCCVAGGGPAGIMLGLLLARAGVKVTVLEKHRTFLRDFRGDTVHPSTLRLLDELGLGERFAELSSSRLREMRVEIDGTPVVASDFGRVPGRHKYLAIVPQWDYLNLIATAAAEEPTFELRMSTAATGLTFGRGGRVTGVRYERADGTTGEIAADLTVACDGRDSVVREAAGLRPDWRHVPMDLWQIRVPSPNAHADGHVTAKLGGGQIGMTMDRGGYYQTWYVIEKGRDRELRSQNIEHFRERLAGLFGWTDGETDAVLDWDEVKLLDITMGRLRRWYREGLLCIGDAAHIMTPAGGFGVNLAVHDAVAAARLLAGPLHRGTLTSADLARVQKRRQLPARAAQKLQSVEHEMLLKPALEGTISSERMPLLFRLLQRMPALRTATAYIGGFGLRSEHAPGFARRDARAR